MEISPNAGKNLEIIVDGISYARYPIRTHVVTVGDTMEKTLDQYVRSLVAPGDMLFISERICAITQGRAFPIADMKPSWLARMLSKYVLKTKHGIGIGSPYTMELAIREAGTFRILFAAACSAITKPFGLRGVFYHVVGNNINAIDGPCDNTLPPYNGYAKLGPKDPEKLAEKLSGHIGIPVVIIDANDLGVNILGQSAGTPPVETCKAIFKDNPLGQSREQTPIAIIRTNK
ncbi:MAG: F420-0--gamma-glutamyl ligase [Candidatus Pacebacteria bacterium]|nr:F420-0--gamma-glutamyl ligase [Candidatus Paceibacterota bacterium]